MHTHILWSVCQSVAISFSIFRPKQNKKCSLDYFWWSFRIKIVERKIVWKNLKLLFELFCLLCHQINKIYNIKWGNDSGRKNAMENYFVVDFAHGARVSNEQNLDNNLTKQLLHSNEICWFAAHRNYRQGRILNYYPGRMRCFIIKTTMVRASISPIHSFWSLNWPFSSFIWFTFIVTLI